MAFILQSRKPRLKEIKHFADNHYQLASANKTWWFKTNSYYFPCFCELAAILLDWDSMARVGAAWSRMAFTRMIRQLGHAPCGHSLSRGSAQACFHGGGRNFQTQERANPDTQALFKLLHHIG